MIVRCNGSSNESIAYILKFVSENNWCIDPNCTTCGAMDFRNALRNLNGENPTGLIEALSSIEINALAEYPYWDWAVRIALSEIRNASDMDKVLSCWLPKLSTNIRLADIVLYHFVRRGALFAPMGIDMLQKWKVACIDLALATGIESLMESLIYTLSERIYYYPELMDKINQLAGRSQRIQLALERID